MPDRVCCELARGLKMNTKLSPKGFPRARREASLELDPPDAAYQTGSKYQSDWCAQRSCKFDTCPDCERMTGNPSFEKLGLATREPVGSEEARLHASLRPPLKLHVRFARMQLSRRCETSEMPKEELKGTSW